MDLLGDASRLAMALHPTAAARGSDRRPPLDRIASLRHASSDEAGRMTMPDRTRLPPCGRGPCVSTLASRTDPRRRIEPMPFAADLTSVRDAVLSALAALPRLRILERDDVSVHAVARSAWLRIPTDIELRIDAAAGLVQLRVATPMSLRARSHPRQRAEELLRRIEAVVRAR